MREQPAQQQQLHCSISGSGSFGLKFGVLS